MERPRFGRRTNFGGDVGIRSVGEIESQPRAARATEPAGSQRRAKKVARREATAG